MDILRVFTAGSVDDGKSTLIGRLLYETHSIPKAYIAQVEAQCKRLGLENLDFSFFTDGLKEERERKITMDVAYRYFYTKKYKYILADNPGHLEYARNMITGASRADIAILLIDAYRGVGANTFQHLKAIEFLEIPQIILAVNKMDLCGYRENAFIEIIKLIENHISLKNKKVIWIPLTAKSGENIATRSSKMPWYKGECLLEALERSEPEIITTTENTYLKVQNTNLFNDKTYIFAQVCEGSFNPELTLFDLKTNKALHVEAVHSLGILRENYPEDSALNLEVSNVEGQISALLTPNPENFEAKNKIQVELYFCEDYYEKKWDLYFLGLGQEEKVCAFKIQKKLINFEYQDFGLEFKWKENDWCMAEISLNQKVFIPKKARNLTFILKEKASAKTLALGKII